MNAELHFVLDNTNSYTKTENQLAIWRKMRKLAEVEGMTHGKIFNELSMLCMMKNLKVFTPLLGDIEGVQHYLIPDGNFWGSRRHLSYYLEANELGCPVHFPARFIARIQGYDLYLRVKEALKNKYGDDSISHHLK